MANKKNAQERLRAPRDIPPGRDLGRGNPSLKGLSERGFEERGIRDLDGFGPRAAGYFFII